MMVRVQIILPGCSERRKRLYLSAVCEAHVFGDVRCPNLNPLTVKGFIVIIHRSVACSWPQLSCPLHGTVTAARTHSCRVSSDGFSSGEPFALRSLIDLSVGLGRRKGRQAPF
jgi:hypothetical protein